MELLVGLLSGLVGATARDLLSDEARVAYHDVLEVIAEVAGAGAPGDVLGPADEERLWRAGQGLRRRLAADLGTAQAPRVVGVAPQRTGPPARRIGPVPADGDGG
jgi:hypothetical protein